MTERPWFGSQGGKIARESTRSGTCFSQEVRCVSGDIYTRCAVRIIRRLHPLHRRSSTHTRTHTHTHTHTQTHTHTRRHTNAPPSKQRAESTLACSRRSWFAPGGTGSASARATTSRPPSTAAAPRTVRLKRSSSASASRASSSRSEACDDRARFLLGTFFQVPRPATTAHISCSQTCFKYRGLRRPRAMGSIFSRVTARRVSCHRNGRASLVGQAREKPEQRATRLQQRDPEPQRRVVDLCGRRRRVRGAPSACVPGRHARAGGGE